VTSSAWRNRFVPLVLAAATLGFHLLTTTGYGYFRDELYYLANGEHLAFGMSIILRSSACSPRSFARSSARRCSPFV
jgi:hypothetical protein